MAVSVLVDPRAETKDFAVQVVCHAFGHLAMEWEQIEAGMALEGVAEGGELNALDRRGRLRFDPVAGAAGQRVGIEVHRVPLPPPRVQFPPLIKQPAGVDSVRVGEREAPSLRPWNSVPVELLLQPSTGFAASPWCSSGAGAEQKRLQVTYESSNAPVEIHVEQFPGGELHLRFLAKDPSLEGSTVRFRLLAPGGEILLDGSEEFARNALPPHDVVATWQGIPQFTGECVLRCEMFPAKKA